MQVLAYGFGFAAAFLGGFTLMRPLLRALEEQHPPSTSDLLSILASGVLIYAGALAGGGDTGAVVAATGAALGALLNQWKAGGDLWMT